MKFEYSTQMKILQKISECESMENSNEKVYNGVQYTFFHSI